MKLNFDLIIYGSRLRQEYPEVDTLAQSIRENGIIHPITVAAEASPCGTVKQYELIAGGRRYHAYLELRNKFPGEYDEIPVTLKSITSELDLRLCELEENFRREDMTWQESALGIAEFHNLSSRRALQNDERWTQEMTGRLTGMSQANVSFLITVAKSLKAQDQEIWKAENLSEAIKIHLDRKLKEANVERMRRVEQARSETMGKLAGMAGPAAQVTRAPSAPAVVGGGSVGQKSMESAGEPDDDMPDLDKIRTEFEASLDSPEIKTFASNPVKVTEAFPLEYLRQLYFKGDCVEVMKDMKKNGVKIDHIITDPPYGIDMANLDQVSGIDSVVETHGVQDNLDMFEPFLRASFDLLPDHGFLVMWYDLDHHEKLMDIGRKVGFKVQRWPLVWCKSSSCINSTAQFNITKSTEVAMFMRKSSLSILAEKRQNNYFVEPNVKEVDHPFAKPFAVWEQCIKAVSLEGQVVFDPFAGSGSMLYAALKMNRTPLGCEIDESHINNGVDWLHRKLNKSASNMLGV